MTATKKRQKLIAPLLRAIAEYNETAEHGIHCVTGGYDADCERVLIETANGPDVVAEAALIQFLDQDFEIWIVKIKNGPAMLTLRISWPTTELATIQQLHEAESVVEPFCLFWHPWDDLGKASGVESRTMLADLSPKRLCVLLSNLILARENFYEFIEEGSA